MLFTFIIVTIYLTSNYISQVHTYLLCSLLIFNSINKFILLIHRIKRRKSEDSLPPKNLTFEIRVETDARQVYRLIQRALQDYKDEKRGPTMLSVQSPLGKFVLCRTKNFSTYRQIDSVFRKCGIFH